MKLDRNPVSLGLLALAVATSMLLLLAVGTLFGLAEWPLLRFVRAEANGLLSVAIFVSNLLPALCVIVLLRIGSQRDFGGIGQTLNLALFVSVIFAMELFLQFLGGEVKYLFLVPFANLTQLGESQMTDAIVLRLVLPLFGLIVLYLVLRVLGRREPVA